VRAGGEKPTYLQSQQLWQVTKVLAELSLRQAAKSLNQRLSDAAFKYLKEVQKITEAPLGSDWSRNPEWTIVRKNLHKNFALYH
jgi:hypothetical protein